MTQKEFVFTNNDGIEIHVYQWNPNKQVKGIIQIAHGMAERAIRYEYFAKALVNEGFVVYANDHRGHGKSACSIDQLGYISDNNGFADMITDMKSLTDIAKKQNPNVPIILFGHSMGSFLAQRYIQLYADEIDGVILSGTNGKPPRTINVAIWIAKIMMAFKGRKASGKILDQLAFGNYNAHWKPAKTKFDWLSRDENQVQQYVEDPYCGTLFPVSFFHDLFLGMKSIHKKEHIACIPKDLPIYILAGDQDPVSNYGKGIINLYNIYQSLDVQDVSYQLYSSGRHEMLNEINRDEVIENIILWIQKRFM